MRPALAIVFGVALAFRPALAQTGAPQPAPPLHFSVVSLHPWGAHERLPPGFVAGVQLMTGRVLGQCVGLSTLVYFAYHLTGSEPVKGMPKWAGAICSPTGATDAYMLQATMPASTTRDEARGMMQTLLARRFHFAAHWETRQMPVLALVIEPGGLKIKPSYPANDPHPPRGSVGCPTGSPGCQLICCGSQTMAGLAGSLSFVLRRPVIDRTKAAGSYLFGPYGMLRWHGDTVAASSLPSLPALLREQFGLELKPERGPVRVLVITQAQRPLPD